MKKVLLGTTAIVGASVLMAGSAMASDPPQLTVSGNVKFEAYFLDEDLTTYSRGVDFQTDDAVLDFNAKATADNGLKYGSHIEMETENSYYTEASVWLDGPWGWMEMGTNDGAEDLVKTGGFAVLSGEGGWDGGPLRTCSAQLCGPSLIGDTGDANKITYMTPSFSGFRAGVSYVPDTGKTLDNAYSDTAASGNTASQDQNSLGFGVEYKGTFNDVSVHVSGRYVRADNEGDSDSPSADVYEDVSSFAFGGKVGYQGFTFGAGYADNGDSRIKKTRADGGYDAGKWYDVALGYETGPYKIAGGYFHSWAGQGTGNDDDTVDFYSIGGDYTVAPGLDLYTEYNYIQVDRNGTTSDNDANMFMVGTKVTF